MKPPISRPDRYKFVYQRRHDGAWIVTLRMTGKQLGHVSRGDNAPWIAYGPDRVPRGGANTRREAAEILNN